MEALAIALCVLPLFFLLDAVNLCLCGGLLALAALLPLLVSDAPALCLALVPLSIYLLGLSAVNWSRHARVVSGMRDTAALASALAGLVVVGPMQLFFPLVASIRFESMGVGPLVWFLLIALYAMIVVLLLLVFRPRLVIYNVSADELRPVLAEVAAQLDHESRWAGDCLALPTLGVQCHVESLAALRNATLVSSGPKQDPQGWRRLELALRTALGAWKCRATAARSRYSSAGLMLALVVALAVSLDPRGVGQSLVALFGAG